MILPISGPMIEVIPIFKHIVEKMDLRSCENLLARAIWYKMASFQSQTVIYYFVTADRRCR